jgi:hypothetical protein
VTHVAVSSEDGKVTLEPVDFVKRSDLGRPSSPEELLRIIEADPVWAARIRDALDVTDANQTFAERPKRSRAADRPTLAKRSA